MAPHDARPQKTIIGFYVGVLVLLVAGLWLAVRGPETHVPPPAEVAPSVTGAPAPPGPTAAPPPVRASPATAAVGGTTLIAITTPAVAAVTPNGRFSGAGNQTRSGDGWSAADGSPGPSKQTDRQTASTLTWPKFS